jgi:isocitrate/isopropylmalate dehydrogenase
MVQRVAVIEGEDASPEAVRPTLALVEALGLEPSIEWVYPAVGQQGLERYGSTFSDEARELIDSCETTLFGSTSGPSMLALLHLRWGRATYANVRPARWWPGCRSPLARPEGIDFVIVRENLEDLYLGCEGQVEELAPLGLRSTTARKPLVELGPGRFAIKLITEAGSERVIRFAFELAQKRRAAGHRGRLTCSSKYNMLPQSDGLFRETAERLAPEYPDIELQCFIVDDFACRMVAQPDELDVVVLPNLYGDVLSDLAAGLIGGLGLAPSGCYGEDSAYFESAHGSAPDIAGRNIINPTATILSAAMMLEYLGHADSARRLVRAVEAVYAEGKTLTPDQGGAASTRSFCEAVAERL